MKIRIAPYKYQKNLLIKLLFSFLAIFTIFSFYLNCVEAAEDKKETSNWTISSTDTKPAKRKVYISGAWLPYNFSADPNEIYDPNLFKKIGTGRFITSINDVEQLQNSRDTSYYQLVF